MILNKYPYNFMTYIIYDIINGKKASEMKAWEFWETGQRVSTYDNCNDNMCYTRQNSIENETAVMILGKPHGKLSWTYTRKIDTRNQNVS